MRKPWNKIPENRLIGKVYNFLTIMSIKDFVGKTIVLAKCECGHIKEYILSNIRNGHTKSCGCLRSSMAAKNSFRHGLHGHQLYITWRNMKDRCYNENNQRYALYGGRGIIVFRIWRNNFESFYNWAIKNGWENGLEIDRKNVNGNYEPDNCRFVTGKINCNNKRNNKILIINGFIGTMKQVSEKFGINYKTLFNRVKAGWTIEEAVRSPKLINQFSQKYKSPSYGIKHIFGYIG